ncbi:MAG: pyrroline-5-carboxylate reductase [Chitinophagaceae bacterium]|nr:MAG: pyrroline-5-carboxylate reductase [Chitinophagaceae bacterium]
MKATILGAGNIGMALAEGLVQSGTCKKQEVTLTKRNLKSLTELQKKGFKTNQSNIEAIKDADTIFVCVLPQQLNELLQEIQPAIDPKKQLIVSVVTGAHTTVFKEILGDRIRIIRAMPNTAMKVRESMTCLSSANATQKDMSMVQELFNTMGQSIVIEEEMMSAATALCACGIAFFLRIIRAASQGGVEIGFHAGDALRIASQTALGAAKLLTENKSHPEQEIDKVTSPKGCTIAGLNEMEHQGLSSAMIKGIKLSATIANNLYKS